MNLRKLLFALSTITLVGTPVLSVVACTKTQSTVDLAKLGALTAISADMVADDPQNVTGPEITTMVNKTIIRAIEKLGLSGTKAVTDFTTTIKTNTDGILQPTTNLAVEDRAKRTFKVIVKTTSTNPKLIGTSREILVTLLEMSVVTVLKTLKNLTVTVADIIASDLENVTVPEIKAIFNIVITRAVNALDGVNGAVVNDDFTYTIKTDDGSELEGPYNFINDDTTFKVVVKANVANKKLIGQSDLLDVTLLMIKKFDLTGQKPALEEPTDYSSINDRSRVSAAQVLDLFETIIKDWLISKTSNQNIKKDVDYTFIIADSEYKIITKESDKTYNFSIDGKYNESVFRFTIKAASQSKLLTGQTYQWSFVFS